MVKKQKNKKQIAKELKRKEKAKKRVLSRRKVLRADAKQQKEIETLEWKYRERQTPLRKAHPEEAEDVLEGSNGVGKMVEDANSSAETAEERDEKIVDKLKHNLEVLNALQDQYFAEESGREDLNQEFLDAGVTTMEEKMEYLKDKAKKEYDEKSLTDPTNYPPMPSENMKPVRAKVKQVEGEGVAEVVDIAYEKIGEQKESIKKELKGGD
jgi:hypothetical protein